MTQHRHSTHVEGCYRCELSKDEADDIAREIACEERGHHRHPESPEPDGDVVAYKCRDCDRWVRT